MKDATTFDPEKDDLAGPGQGLERAEDYLADAFALATDAHEGDEAAGFAWLVHHLWDEWRPDANLVPRRRPIPPKLRAEVFERDEFACVECGSDDELQCDHTIPVSKGGTTDLENLRTLCRHCNARKGNR